MSVTFYIPQDNGSLKLVEEVEGTDRPDLALDALLDEMPKVANQSNVFRALISEDGGESGEFVTVTLDSEDIVQPRRAISIGRAAKATAKRSSNGRRKKAPAKPAPEPEPEVEEAPKRTTRKKPGPKPGSKRKPAAKKTTRKPAAKKPPAKKASGKKSPFTANAASAE